MNSGVKPDVTPLVKESGILQPLPPAFNGSKILRVFLPKRTQSEGDRFLAASSTSVLTNGDNESDCHLFFQLSSVSNAGSHVAKRI